MKCPGQDSRYWKPGAIFEESCPKCGHSVEFFKDDTTRICKSCGHRFLNPSMDFGCASYCAYAEQCIGNLPPDASEDSVREMFAAYGTVRSINVASDIFTGKCKGFGFVEMEGHEARAAQAALDGNLVGGGERSLRVRFDDPRAARGRRRR